MKETIKLQCESCGCNFKLPMFCPYTGIVHGGGWEYTCEVCKGTLKEIKNDKQD